MLGFDMKKLLVWVLILFIGCGQKSPYQFESEVVVFSLFIAGRPNPTVKLERSWEIDKQLPDGGLAVNNAEVSVITEGDTIKYALIEDKSGIYEPLDSLIAYPLKTYHLEITVPEEDKIYGETTVPDTFSIIQPAEGDTLDKSGQLPPIIWGSSQNAKGYLVDISSRVATTHVIGIMSAVDTVLPLLSFFLGDSGKQIMKIVALDGNYYDYYMESLYQSGTESTNHIQNGIGVFGSCVVESVQVYVK